MEKKDSGFMVGLFPALRCPTSRRRKSWLNGSLPVSRSSILQRSKAYFKLGQRNYIYLLIPLMSPRRLENHRLENESSVASRLRLKDEQIREFWSYLQGLPAKNQV